jgi:hypothetical protein
MSDSNTPAARYVYYLDRDKTQDETYDPSTHGYGISLSPREITQPTRFAGWDFDSVWTILEGEYPHLRWEDSAGGRRPLRQDAMRRGGYREMSYFDISLRFLLAGGRRRRII